MHEDAAVASTPRLFLRKALSRLFLSGVVLFCLPTGLALASRWLWVGELATHFTWWYAAIALPLLALLMWRRRRWPSALVAATLFVNLVRLAPLYLPTGEQEVSGDTLRVMTQNVWKPNTRHEDFVQLVRRESPDVLLLSEVNQRWLDALKPLEAGYPYRGAQLRGTRSGMAIYSRLPLEGLRFERLGPIDRYCAIATLSFEGESITLLGMHPSLPRRPKNRRWRDEELLAAAAFASEQPGQVILLGDLNTTPWSPVFSDVLRVGGLRNSMRGFGVQPSWSLQGWELVGLPIDHVLHTPGLRTVDRRIGGDVGSDHRAVVVDFLLTTGD